MTADDTPGLAPRRFVLLVVLVVLVAAAVRGLFPAADPPWRTTAGIVWHDEGAWVHNARNKALFGAWNQDEWNPMYVAPVFTLLEYASFELFGVGVRQARVVSILAGVTSVLLIALGVRRCAGSAAGLIAGALLATNYEYVMWNRTALMEGPMVAFIVASWYCYVRAQTQPGWGFAAAAFAVLAFFTKASAAFFVAALVLDAAMTLMFRAASGSSHGVQTTDYAAAGAERRAAVATLAGLVAWAAIALVIFVMPHWREYRFYNWQMSVVRKPSYDLKSLRDRLTWFPITHDMFTRMWFVLVVGTTYGVSLLARGRRLAAGERLLLAWIGLGALEVVLHDAGNERRFIFFIPAFVALAAIALGRARSLAAPEAAAVPRRRALLALPVVLFAAYVMFGAIVRMAFLYEIKPNVRIAAVLATLFTVILYATWPRIPQVLSRRQWTPAAGVAIGLVVAAGQLAPYVQWASGRTYKNYEASRALARVLPPGTLVQGKLANGLSLENRIRPVFIGRGFGNYDDRKRRDDVRYILTYVAPSVGYESQARNPVIQDVLDAYPNRRIVMTFDVAETATGHDRAALFDKFGAVPAGGADGAARAKH